MHRGAAQWRKNSDEERCHPPQLPSNRLSRRSVGRELHIPAQSFQL
jgi:hypothetical protein